MYTSRIALLMIAALIAGCGRSPTYVTPDGKVVVQRGNKPGQVTYSGKDGKVTIDASGTKLPDDYPKDVPVPSPAKITMAVSGNNGAAKTANIVLQSDDSADNLVAFYKKGLADNGWTINQTTATGLMTIFGATKEAKELVIEIVDADGKRSVTQAYTAKN